MEIIMVNPTKCCTVIVNYTKHTYFTVEKPLVRFYEKRRDQPKLDYILPLWDTPVTEAKMRPI